MCAQGRTRASRILATDKGDPRRALFGAVRCPGDCGNVVVYHQQFRIPATLRACLVLPEFAGRIEKIQRRSGTCFR